MATNPVARFDHAGRMTVRFPDLPDAELVAARDVHLLPGQFCHGATQRGWIFLPSAVEATLRFANIFDPNLLVLEAPPPEPLDARSRFGGSSTSVRCRGAAA